MNSILKDHRDKIDEKISLIKKDGSKRASQKEKAFETIFHSIFRGYKEYFDYSGKTSSDDIPVLGTDFYLSFNYRDYGNCDHCFWLRNKSDLRFCRTIIKSIDDFFYNMADFENRTRIKIKKFETIRDYTEHFLKEWADRSATNENILDFAKEIKEGVKI